ncbi:PREDICTED: rho GTPase-activating protein 40-like isoform X2 [Poecilia mexicana]|uniref:rho GTPase-activating protein 40-like isoform X2 n=1 Tax=Poecilia mexicana TaxID=48701 RepID=UPI00072DB19E|nr:PREDICTED: rho GTPase-activating protein 40-like isoform X2 [Poecilia mexicana]
MGGREKVVLSRMEPKMHFSHFRLNTFKLRLDHNPTCEKKRMKKTSSKKKARDPSPTEMSVEPWASPQDQAAAEHARSKNSPPAQEQEQPDKLCLESFWSEVETIRQGCGEADLDPTRRDSRQSEEGEQEEQWLADAGLSTLISEDSEDVDKAVLLSTLTRTQAEAVQRRLDSYTLSRRKKNKLPPRDVRDIFSSPIAQALLPESQNSKDLPQKSMASVAKMPFSVSPEHQRAAPKEEFLITDIAYCEQAVIFIKQANFPLNNIPYRKEDGTLPRVICPKCRLGVTRIQDLSHADMKKVRQLALIDMTALCDLLELEVKRHKTGKRKIAESTLFGVPLSTLLETDQKIRPNTSIPLFLHTLLSFLEKKGVDSEGILRVPGSQSRIKLLQQNLEANFYRSRFNWDEVSPNDAAALLKKFIRELPDPLLTAEYLNTFSAVRDITELRQKLHMLNLLILLLPEPNRSTLKALLEFLSKVVSREKKNRMNLWAVATIMAPNLFLHKAVPSRLTDGAEKGQAEKAADVMRLLIRYQDLLWTVPNFLMSQVRRLNENSNRRYQFKNLLRKIQPDSREKPEKNSEPRRTIKIQVGDLVNGTMEFQLNINCRTSDLLAQFYRQFLRSPENGKGKMRRNGSVGYPDCALYEVGGNIGEHCLDTETHLLDLYNSNPGGEWVIKTKPNGGRGQ